jgi:hypothetical protein
MASLLALNATVSVNGRPASFSRSRSEYPARLPKAPCDRGEQIFDTISESCKMIAGDWPRLGGEAHGPVTCARWLTTLLVGGFRRVERNEILQGLIRRRRDRLSESPARSRSGSVRRATSYADSLHLDQAA